MQNDDDQSDDERPSERFVRVHSVGPESYTFPGNEHDGYGWKRTSQTLSLKRVELTPERGQEVTVHKPVHSVQSQEVQK